VIAKTTLLGTLSDPLGPADVGYKAEVVLILGPLAAAGREAVQSRSPCPELLDI